MMNHIAVILRGHPRTWHLISDHTLRNYDKLAKKVDYYFVTWFIPNTSTVDITNSFKGRNLINFVAVPIIKEYYNSYYSSCWLPYNILPYKRQREKTVKYDAVIDSRPDVAVQVIHNRYIVKPEENCLYTTQLELHHNWATSKKDIALSDWFFMSTSRVYDIMAERFTFHDNSGTQITHRLFAERENINICTLDYIETFLARPNIYNMELNDTTFLSVSYESKKWGNFSREERKKFAQFANVREEDYNTNCLHAAI